MFLSEAINELVKRKEWTKIRLVREAGYTHATAVTTPMARENIQLSSLVKLANAAGYDVMLVSRDVTRGERPIILEVPEDKLVEKKITRHSERSKK